MNVHLCKNKGFTLVELLVTMAVVSIIMVAVISAFNIQQKAQVKQQLITEVQQNGRAAAYMLARDIRMTSFGLGDGVVTYWDGSTHSNYSAINIEDGGNGPDRIKILYAATLDLLNPAYLEVNALATTQVSLSQDVLNVDDATGFVPGELAIITNGDFSSIFQITGVSPQNLGHNPDTGVNPPVDTMINPKGAFGVGSAVYRLRYITYDVSYADPSHPVMRIDRDGPTGGSPFEIIAEDIEDLQAVYIFEDGVSANDLDVGPSNHDYAHIRAVRVTVLARTRVEKEEFKGGRRPTIENHLQGPSDDSYGRRLITLELKIRNFGL